MSRSVTQNKCPWCGERGHEMLDRKVFGIPVIVCPAMPDGFGPVATLYSAEAAVSSLEER